MEKTKYFLIGRNDYFSNWEIISVLTEDKEEVMAWYNREMDKGNRHFVHIKICETTYG